MDNKILEIKNLTVEYYRNRKVITAVNNISFNVNENETLSIVGESGCGKSTVALSILNLINSNEGRITTGEIIYNKKYDILKMNKNQLQQLRGNEITIIFQDPFSSLNPVLTVGTQLIEILQSHYPELNFSDMKEKVINLLSHVQINDPERIFNSYPHQLSGGQRQRICIAAGIITNPRILIADEPTTALDVTTAKDIIELLSSLQNKLKLSIIFITHNLYIAFKHSHRIIVMYAGEFVEEGATDDISKEPKHPYTQMLLKVLPTLDKKGKKLNFIPGQVPDMLSLPKGCRFHPRCDKVMDICTKNIPTTYEYIRNGIKNKVKCFLYE